MNGALQPCAAGFSGAVTLPENKDESFSDVSLCAGLELLVARRSIRKFSTRPVPEALIRRLVTYGTWAPSAGNRQEWFFTVVTDCAVKSAMVSAVEAHWSQLQSSVSNPELASLLSGYAHNFSWFGDAPAVVLVSTRALSSFEQDYFGTAAWLISGGMASAAMAAQNILLAAQALGLGACCLTGPLAAAADLKTIAQVPRRHEIVCLLAIGYGAEPAASAPLRKELMNILKIV